VTERSSAAPRAPSHARLLKGAGGIALASVGAQLITLAVMPIAARLYSPSAFGIYSGAIAIVSLGATAVHGRYHLALGRVSNPAERAGILQLALLLAGVTSPFVVGAIALGMGGGGSPLGGALTLALCAALTCGTAAIDVLAVERSLAGRIRLGAVTLLLRAGVAGVSQLGLVALGPLGLLVGSVVGVGAAVAVGIVDVLRRGALTMPVGRGELLRLARKHRDFPVFGLPQGVAASMGWNLFPLILFRFAGSAVAGQYWVAYRVLMAPLTLLNASYRQAALRELTSGTRAQQRGHVVAHTLVIVSVALLGAVVLWGTAEWVFVVAFGSGWTFASQLAGVLAFSWVADGGKIPALTWLQSRGENRRVLSWEISILPIRYLVVVPLVVSGEVFAAALAFSIIGVIGWALFVGGVLKEESLKPASSL